MLGCRWRQSLGHDVEQTREPIGHSLGACSHQDVMGYLWMIVAGMQDWDAGGDGC